MCSHGERGEGIKTLTGSSILRVSPALTARVKGVGRGMRCVGMSMATKRLEEGAGYA